MTSSQLYLFQRVIVCLELVFVVYCLARTVRVVRGYYARRAAVPVPQPTIRMRIVLVPYMEGADLLFPVWEHEAADWKYPPDFVIEVDVPAHVRPFVSTQVLQGKVV